MSISAGATFVLLPWCFLGWLKWDFFNTAPFRGLPFPFQSQSGAATSAAAAGLGMLRSSRSGAAQRPLSVRRR